MVSRDLGPRNTIVRGTAENDAFAAGTVFAASGSATTPNSTDTVSALRAKRRAAVPTTGWMTRGRIMETVVFQKRAVDGGGIGGQYQPALEPAQLKLKQFGDGLGARID